MRVDEGLMLSFLLVFVRCGAMLFSSPIFGAQNTPLQIRTYITLAISGALTLAVRPDLGVVPTSLFELGSAILQELVAGLLLGTLVTFALTAAQMAGAIMDFQSGLSMSQEMNPASGVPISILSQFQYLLATVVLLATNGHHLILLAFVQSYKAMPDFTPQHLAQGIFSMVAQSSLLAVQIAIPVIGASMVVDAALGLVNKAVPQMPAMLVGGPAKQAVGLTTVALSLPALAAAVTNGTHIAMTTFGHLFK